MLWALLEYLPPVDATTRILELGCGTGNLSLLLADKYPQASIEFVDISPDSLDVCRQRLGNDSRFRFRAADFRFLPQEDASVDLVVSSIAIHHLQSEEKRQLFSRLFGLLKAGGCFAYADQHAGDSDRVRERHLANWQAISMQAGSCATEWQMWMEHQRDHDHHDTTVKQIDWLRESGFVRLDCPWRYLLWTVLLADKPL